MPSVRVSLSELARAARRADQLPTITVGMNDRRTALVVRYAETGERVPKMRQSAWGVEVFRQIDERWPGGVYMTSEIQGLALRYRHHVYPLQSVRRALTKTCSVCSEKLPDEDGALGLCGGADCAELMSVLLRLSTVIPEAERELLEERRRELMTQMEEVLP